MTHHSKDHKNKSKDQEADMTSQTSSELEQETEENFEPNQAPGIDFPSRSELENQLTALEMKITEYQSQALRAHAELENVRKRAERDVSNAYKYGAEKLLNDLLPVIDSLAHGLVGAEPSDPKLKTMREGMRMTFNMLEKTLQKHGVEIIEPTKGESFNPALHQAMSSMSDPNAKSNTIIEVMQKGYMLNGRVLRAALVIVAQ